MNTRDNIAQILEALGVSRRFRGYGIASEALFCVLASGEGLISLTEQVYAPLLERYACSWRHLERNLRTVIQRAWQVNAALLQEMAAYPLNAPPTVSEFIDILSTYMMRRGLCGNAGMILGARSADTDMHRLSLPGG